MRIALVLLASCFLALAGTASATPEKQDPQEILRRCIQKHGGEQKFRQAQTIYSEMFVHSPSEQGDIESTLKQYFRRPDKLRIEIYPNLEQPTKLGWNGKEAWQLAKDSLEKTDDPKIAARMKETIRFLSLMLLDNLFEKNTVLSYDAYFEQVKIHVISHTDTKGEKVRFYVNGEFVLQGADFYWGGTEDLFIVKFFEHQMTDTGILLPMYTEMYRRQPGQDRQLLMKARLRTIRINSLYNGNSFFTNLREQPRTRRQ